MIHPTHYQISWYEEDYKQGHNNHHHHHGDGCTSASKVTERCVPYLRDVRSFVERLTVKSFVWLHNTWQVNKLHKRKRAEVTIYASKIIQTNNIM